MKKNTIERVVRKKLNEWLDSITDEKLRGAVKSSLLLSGGSIASMFLQEDVNDYDIYIQNHDVLLRLVKYYKLEAYNGNEKDEYIKDYFTKRGHMDFSDEDIKSDNSFHMIFLKSLHPGQVKIDIDGAGKAYDLIDNIKYQLSFASQNAISLTDDIQIVTRFSGTPEEIHKTFDFIHATNYFTFSDGLVTNLKAMESLITKELMYQGSLYPLTSVIRMKKFIGRRWTCNAGEILKMCFQISDLNLKDPAVLEEQLIGVDIAYFSQLVKILRGVEKSKLDSPFIVAAIDKVFNQIDEDNDN